MENKDKTQMILISNDAIKRLGKFTKDIENSPLNAYENLRGARDLINEIINRLFIAYVED